MPPVFATLMADIEKEAIAAVAGHVMPESNAAAADDMWQLFRMVKENLPAKAPSEWTAAMFALLEGPRNGMMVNSLYADDAHTAGYFYTALQRALWRVVVGRTKGLTEAPKKCGLLTSPHWRAHLDTLIMPLRDGPGTWEMTESFKVLGVTFADPGDKTKTIDAVIAGLAETVVAPTRRLIQEIEEGEKKSTALFIFHRYIQPVLTYHQGAWGLLVGRELWRGVDEALNDLCAALCPADLRVRLADPRSSLRRELALPTGDGGLGIPLAASEAPVRAAEQWSHSDAIAAGGISELMAAAYVRDEGALGRDARPQTIAAHHKKEAEAMAAAATRQSARRHQQNNMRGGTRAFDSVPWREELSIDNIDFDIAWRLVFGGMTPVMVDRVDHTPSIFTYRGERMEWALDQALHACLPPSTITTGMKPAPEIFPVDAEPLDVHDRADVDVLTKTGRRFVFDVRTVNVQCRSGIDKHASAKAHCAAIEVEKRTHYMKYYRAFAPIVVTLSGAVTQASAVALLRVAREVAKGHRTALDWEPAKWVDNILHRMSVEMIKTVSIIATRTVLPCVNVRAMQCRASLGRF